jgi:hypothetical protein
VRRASPTRSFNVNVHHFPVWTFTVGRVVRASILLSFGMLVIRWKLPRYNDQGADELTFLDIRDQRWARHDLHIISRGLESVHPTVGGGVAVEDVQRLLTQWGGQNEFQHCHHITPTIIQDCLP